MGLVRSRSRARARARALRSRPRVLSRVWTPAREPEMASEQLDHESPDDELRRRMGDESPVVIDLRRVVVGGESHPDDLRRLSGDVSPTPNRRAAICISFSTHNYSTFPAPDS